MDGKFIKGVGKVSRDDIRRVLEKARVLLEIVAKHMLKFLEDVMLFVEMLRAYFRGEYPALPLVTVAAIVLTLLYILDPLDAVPDFIPGLGFTDDMAVLAACIALCKKDVDRFKRWRKRK